MMVRFSPCATNDSNLVGATGREEGAGTDGGQGARTGKTGTLWKHSALKRNSSTLEAFINDKPMSATHLRLYTEDSKSASNIQLAIPNVVCQGNVGRGNVLAKGIL